MTLHMLNYSSILSRTLFIYGRVFAFEDLGYNNIALDGAVQGPRVDPENRRFSFDHHTDCLRLVTSATCVQVREALILGLEIDDRTGVYINDIDGDTVLSYWLLAHPERATDPRVETLVAQIGRTDGHGPVIESHPIHDELTPLKPWMEGYVPQSLDMLVDMLTILDRWWAGEWVAPVVKNDVPVVGWGWAPRKGWTHVETLGRDSDDFGPVYRAGFVMGFLHSPAASDTTRYIVAKGSDLVAGNLGPGSAKRPMTGPEDALESILGALALAEFAKNPDQSWAATWGGGSSIGGSPRNAVPEGEAGSVLTSDEVLAVFKRFRP
jgi:hypothetical protein